MSDDPNEFQVIEIRDENDNPMPFLRTGVMTPALKARLIAGGFTENEVKRGGFMFDSHGNLAGVIMLEPTEQADDKPQDNVASPETADFKAWITDHMGFPDRLYFWTSSRGDHWEKIEADSAENAAIMQAERWNQKGHRGPFTIMVSLSGRLYPPGHGDRVTVFELVPEVLFKATRLDYKILSV